MEAAAPSAAGYASPLAQELAADVLDRFVRYARIDTQAVEGSSTYPSSERQLDLSRLLLAELRGLGLEDAELTEHGYVLRDPAGDGGRSGRGADRARRHDAGRAGRRGDSIVHRAYAGGPIAAARRRARGARPGGAAELAARIGHDIVTSDGTTLLGADDKAGVAEIMAAVAYLLRHPEPGRAPSRIAFTVDEEVGHGTDHFDLDRFGADFAYTLDGSGIGELEVETFSAYTVRVTFQGNAVHPGSAKGRLVNAVKLAGAMLGALPPTGSPRNDRGREGYVHPVRVRGSAVETVVTFIARDHDDTKLEEHVTLIRRLAEEAAAGEPRARVAVEVEESYRNMRQVLERHPDVVAAAEEAIRRAGVEPKSTIIRGGTDGARLGARPTDAEPLHRRAGLPLGPGVGERAGHGGRGSDGCRAGAGLPVRSPPGEPPSD